MFAPKFTPKFTPKILSYSSQTFALKLSSIFSPKYLSPKHFNSTFTLNVLPSLFTPKIFPHSLWFPPPFSPRFYSKIFFPNVFPPSFLPTFNPNFSPKILSHSSQTFAPKFPSSFPPKMFLILIINFYPLLFTSKFSPHSSLKCAPICFPPSLLQTLPPRFLLIVRRLLPSNCPTYFPPKICLPNILPLPLPPTFYPHFLPPSFSPIVFRIVPPRILPPFLWE